MRQRSASLATRFYSQLVWYRNTSLNRNARLLGRGTDGSGYGAHKFATYEKAPALPTLNPFTTNVHNDLDLEKTTIYALSTAPGRAGIAVIRISGPACRTIYNSLCPGMQLLKPRLATVRTLYEPHTKPSLLNILDKQALLISFPGHRTVTGEEVLELHVHGGNATVKAVLAAIPRCKALNDLTIGPIRYAEPGEFTRRAFENNRLDLTQVEALSEALSADTEMQRRAAITGSTGVLGRQYERWRQQLLEARGELEAIIDFSEDQDFEVENGVLLKHIEEQLRPMVAGIEQHEEGSRRGELVRSGIRISLLGPPNSGKSSLLNRIVGREASIVSTEAGTTRDIVEVSVDIEGYLCIFADTAGLRSQVLKGHEVSGGIGVVEQEGIRRAKEKAEKSDFIIAFASVEMMPGTDQYHVQYHLETLRMASQAQKCVIVVNKMDLVPEELPIIMSKFKSALALEDLEYDPESILTISCKPELAELKKTLREDPGNIRNLLTRLASSFKEMTIVEPYIHMGVTERQRQLLIGCRENCLNYLQEAQKADSGDDSFDIVVAAEHLRSAATCLSRITGRGEGGDVEEVLGVVFEKFCVGK